MHMESAELIESKFLSSHTRPEKQPANTPKFEQLGKSKQATTQGFVAINYITVRPDYAERMESLFESRAGCIDNCGGFRKMQVLRPRSDTNEYLVISEWDSESDFKAWTQSAEFQLGHRRAFDDLAQARKHNESPPMISNFRAYDIIESS